MSETVLNLLSDQIDQIKDPYMIDGHKMLWHLDRVVRWQHAERIAPLRIDMGITNGCSLNCLFCYGIVEGRTTASNRVDMPLKPLLRLLKDAKDLGVKSVNLVGEGENTLNPAMYPALEYARSINLSMSLATNGLTLWYDKLADILPCLSWIKFNLCAATEETYEIVHGVDGKFFQRVIGNIRRCLSLRKNTVIGIQMVVVRENVNDILPLSKLARDLGADYLSIKPASDTPERSLNVPHSEYAGIEDILKEAQSYSTEKYSVVVKWKKMMNAGMKSFKVCQATPFFIAISGTGGVYPCGHFFNKPDWLMGNIIDRSLKEIISSERYWEIHDKIKRLDVNRDCETNCGHYYINQFLWRLKNPPEHVNFI